MVRLFAVLYLRVEITRIYIIEPDYVINHPIQDQIATLLPISVFQSIPGIPIPRWNSSPLR